MTSSPTQPPQDPTLVPGHPRPAWWPRVLQDPPDRKVTSLKSIHSAAKKNRHWMKRAWRPPKGTVTKRALRSLMAPARLWVATVSSQAVAKVLLKRHSTSLKILTPLVCMLLQWTWRGRGEG
ncbi:hypothetical protein WISP_00915 [Willisornis vidua]|uniref:Uncharacterized protein n=1 Tax=Willisornis vidua TaxID=1566151 RepID=A0ABQ9E1A5_9PASS|nr:hypothetical protein WISP_00915 [Willisornis vidua]